MANNGGLNAVLGRERLYEFLPNAALTEDVSIESRRELSSSFKMAASVRSSQELSEITII